MKQITIGLASDLEHLSDRTLWLIQIYIYSNAEDKQQLKHTTASALFSSYWPLNRAKLNQHDNKITSHVQVSDHLDLI